MSDIDEYPRVRTDIEMPEAQRRDADAINYLLGRVATTEDVLVLMILIARENGVLHGTATDNTTIDNWQFSALASTESILTVNPVTGLFTIGVTGVYEFSTTMVYTGVGNNIQYGLGIILNGTPQPAFAYNVWSNATSAQSFTGTGVATFTAGDTVGLVKTATVNAMNNISGNVTLKLSKPT